MTMNERGGVKMLERPILFSWPMVRAILEGRKTQTRRIVKPQPPCGCSYIINGAYSHALCFSTETVIDGKFTDKTIWVPPTPTSKDHRLVCPYGEPGDRLWVRETWAALRFYNGIKPRDIPKDDFIYRACDAHVVSSGCAEEFGPWRPSIHMPRWASRITLEITDVRVERLQAISHDDAIAEGTDWKTCPAYQSVDSLNQQRMASRMGMSCFPVLTIDYIGGYKKLWESIHGPGSWAANPWVWVIEFKMVTDNA